MLKISNDNTINIISKQESWENIDEEFNEYWKDLIDGDFRFFSKGEKALSKIKWLRDNYNPPVMK